MSDYNIVGKRMPRIDTRAKVMGKVRYSADIKLHGMLVGKIKRCRLRLSRPYARIRWRTDCQSVRTGNGTTRLGKGAPTGW